MKILMIAPEPFFESRGTPFSEYFRITALCRLGHTVDLVTYPLGRDRKIKGLKIFRCWRPPLVKSVKTGPSITKVVLDFFLFFKVIGRLFRGKYQLIHTHEEANIMGVFFNKITGIPHLYDMHASLVQHMSNFKFTQSRLIIFAFKLIERLSLKNARSVIVICQSLFDHAATLTDKNKLTVIENFIDETPEKVDQDRLAKIKLEIGSTDKKIIMYTGTLEAYQGIPLLIESMSHLPDDFRLVLIGGEPVQIEAVKRQARAAGQIDKILFLGKRQPADIPYYLKASDVLVSPRILGTNIPLKIYSFLKSGIPVVATNLYTHTQSIGKDIAVLVDPDPLSFARGIEAASGKQGKDIGQKAAAYCQKKYTFDQYLNLVDIAVKKALNN